MEVKIIRGGNQIGGTIIEVTSECTRLILDAGTELEEIEDVVVPDVPGLFSDETSGDATAVPNYDAVLISHYHRDHTGLLNYVLPGIPIYMARKMFCIHKKISERMGKEIKYSPVIIDADNQPLDGSYSFYIGDIKVTPFLCDHSAFDSYMYLLETEDDSILYTGDFRSNGRKDFEGLLQRLPEHVDKLICEGTTLSRETYKANETEESLEVRLAELMQGDKPVFVISATTNIDRITSTYNACHRTGRILAMDVFQADLLEAIGEVPAPSNCKDVRVGQVGDPEKEHKEILRYNGSKIGRGTLEKQRFAMLLRTSGSMMKYLEGMKAETLSGATLVYSMWRGYLADERTSEFVDFCKERGMNVVYMHTSGHADAMTIKALVDKVSQDDIIPVHTKNPQAVKEMKGRQTWR